MHARLHRLPPAASRAAVVALLVVLVLAQTLGWMHRALHGDAGAGSRHGLVAAAAEAATHADTAHGAGLHDLFGSHAEPNDCRLFDALGQPGCMPAPLVVLPVLLPAASLALTHADFVARWAALFDARGPPPTR